jgi:predicted amidohydrolase YtcJ
MKVERCYDSHLHLEATGEFSERLSLFHFENLDQFKNLKPLPSQMRGAWWMGFGILPSLHEKLSLQFLDQWQEPLYFMTADGHGVWVNSALLKTLAQIPPSDRPGFYKDKEKDQLDQFLPQPELSQRKNWILKAQKIMHEQGFTHVRDMTWDIGQLLSLNLLESEADLKLFVEGYFWLKSMSSWSQFLDFLDQYKQLQSSQLKLRGVKIFYDGALGTKGALLSFCSCHKKNHGSALWTEADFLQVLERSWTLGLEVAVHAIGDEAVHQVAEMAFKLQSQKKISGKICIEHAELVRPETFQFLQKINCEIHMQPSHLLMDKDILQPFFEDHRDWVFPWSQISKCKIPLFWGSDSPIVEPNFFRTEKALLESQKLGILRPNFEWIRGHQHSDPSWGAECWSEFKDQNLSAVYFQGKKVFPLK